MLAASNLVYEVRKELTKKQVWLMPDLAPHKYKIDNKVWLLTDHLVVPGAKKFRVKYIGPYMVLDTPPNAVHLHLPTRIWIHPIVNMEWIKPYHDPILRQHTHHPGLAIISDDGQEE